MTLDTALPHGSLQKAEVVRLPMASKVHLMVQGIRSITREVDEGWRHVDPEWVVAAMALTLFKGHSHIKNISPRRKPGDAPLPPGRHDNHYVYMHEDEGGSFTWERLIAGAGSDEAVKLGANHHDLTMESLTTTTTRARRAWKTREDAIGESLRLYEGHRPKPSLPRPHGGIL